MARLDKESEIVALRDSRNQDLERQGKHKKKSERTKKLIWDTRLRHRGVFIMQEILNGLHVIKLMRNAEACAA